MPAPVYHYTDSSALTSIVEHTAIWATDFRYLNDATELTYAWNAFVDQLKQLTSVEGESSQAYSAQLKALQLMDAVDLMAFDDAVFVACFSELDDSLSQWSRYGANGHGFALGFDPELIGALAIPIFHHSMDGQLTRVEDQNCEPFSWKAFLQKVRYGDLERDRIVESLLRNVRQTCGMERSGASFDQDVGNCVFQTHALVHRLPLVKHVGFEDEGEHRITLTEHMGGRSAGQRRALLTLPKPYRLMAQGPLETVDVRFRPGGPTLFKPYVSITFDRAALKEVVIGPALKHRLAESTVRRMLDRHGFRHTTIRSSTLPYQG